mgnify:CR=1 FL=1
MIRTLALSLALVAVVPLAATAHGPSRQKVNKSIEITKFYWPKISQLFFKKSTALIKN